jgi:hypothetical protein
MVGEEKNLSLLTYVQIKPTKEIDRRKITRTLFDINILMFRFHGKEIKPQEAVRPESLYLFFTKNDRFVEE